MTGPTCPSIMYDIIMMESELESGNLRGSLVVSMSNASTTGSWNGEWEWEMGNGNGEWEWEMGMGNGNGEWEWKKSHSFRNQENEFQHCPYYSRFFLPN